MAQFENGSLVATQFYLTQMRKDVFDNNPILKLCFDFIFQLQTKKTIGCAFSSG